MRPARLLYLFLLLCMALPARADYLNDLTRAAHEQGLAQRREWLTLLHYERDARGRHHSAAQSAFFFASPQGTDDPDAELDATLAAFFDPSARTPRDEPAQCMWIARYRWLSQTLHFDGQRLPALSCERFQRWHDGLAPAGVALIFPDAFPNAPASMFGHTLLRLDGKGQDAQSRLLAYSINFGAEVPSNPNALVYAVKGFFGGYQGYFSLNPYYQKVREYAYIENRNIWEYPLKLSAEELDRLVLHLWELRGVAFPYYFALRNCSYELLSLLEAAKPDLDLTRHFSAYAMPVDTIRALRGVPDLLGPALLRSAQKTRTLYEERFLSHEQRRLAMRVAFEGPLSTQKELAELDPVEQARVLETAHDRLYYEHLSHGEDHDHRVDRALEILGQRSALAVNEAFPAMPEPALSPEQAHRTRRVSASGGWEDGSPYVALRARLAVHDLLDPADGYVRGAQLDFFDAALRYLPELEALRVEELKLADIVSLAPRDELFSPISWRFSTGARRVPDRPLTARDPSELAFYLEGGPGLSYGQLDGLLFYVFPLADLEAGGDLAGGHRFALGGVAGLRYEAGPRWTVLAEYRDLASVAGDGSRERRASLSQQLNLERNLGLRLSLTWRDWAGRDYLQEELSALWYF